MSKRAAQDRHEITDLLYRDMDSPVVEPKKAKPSREPVSRKKIAVLCAAALVVGGGAAVALTVRGEQQATENAADISACEQFVKIDDASTSTNTNEITAIAETIRAALTGDMSAPVSEDVRLVAAAYDDIVSRMSTTPVDEPGLAEARTSAGTRRTDAIATCDALLGSDAS